MNTPRRVLIPTYYFPPYGSVGIFRISKIVKHLPKYDWKPYVMTVTPDTHQNTESVHNFSAVREAAAEVIETEVPIENTIQKMAQFTGVSDVVRQNALYSAWIPKLVQKMTEAIDKYDIDLIFSSGGPFLPLISLPFIKYRTGVPYIVDLRDPWTTELQNIEGGGTLNTLRKQITKVAEPRVLSRASRITTVTGKLQKQYQSRYPELSDKFEVVHNGYDKEDYTDVEPEKSSKFRIIYPGKWYGKKHCEQFFEGYSSFVDSADTELVHYGNVDNEIIQVLHEYQIRDSIQFREYSPRETVAATIKGSNLGLVISRNPNALTTKTFDYIACDIPILGLCKEDSTLHDVLSNFEHGYTAPKHDSKKISEALSKIRESAPTGLGSRDKGRQFEFDALTRELSNTFEVVKMNDNTS